LAVTSLAMIQPAPTASCVGLTAGAVTGMGMVAVTCPVRGSMRDTLIPAGSLLAAQIDPNPAPSLGAGPTPTPLVSVPVAGSMRETVP
jgi:hypothetical protein